MTQKGTAGRLDNPPDDNGTSGQTRLPYSGFAIAAMVTAACSILCPPLGIVGVALGALAYHDLRVRAATHRGASLAVIGVVIGGLTTGLTLGVGLWLWERASTGAATRSLTEHASRPQLPLIAERVVVPTGSHAQGDDTTERREGNIVVVDLGPRVHSLVDALDEQRAAAKQAGQLAVLWVVVPECEPCRRVAISLRDERMQQALDGTRLVRVDATKFAVELSRLNVPLDAFPGFGLLGDTGIVDFIHGGEWDADVPENIAPVLKSFVHGTYLKRRHPWRGGPHSDETAL